METSYFHFDKCNNFFRKKERERDWTRKSNRPDHQSLSFFTRRRRGYCDRGQTNIYYNYAEIVVRRLAAAGQPKIDHVPPCRGHSVSRSLSLSGIKVTATPLRHVGIRCAQSATIQPDRPDVSCRVQGVTFPSFLFKNFLSHFQKNSFVLIFTSLLPLRSFFKNFLSQFRRREFVRLSLVRNIDR